MFDYRLIPPKPAEHAGRLAAQRRQCSALRGQDSGCNCYLVEKCLVKDCREAAKQSHGLPFEGVLIQWEG